MHIVRQIIKLWLPLAAAVTLLSGVIYISLQQVIRLGANEPQVGLAEDAAHALAGGASPSSVLPAGQVDLSSSISPYLVVYDSNGVPLASNAVLHGSIPALPPGVLDAARQSGENRVTLQPEPGIREAAVIVPVAGGPGGYVLAARSLREPERLIDLVGLYAGLGWAFTLGATLALVGFLELLPR
jgi:hypothetical protein